MRGKLKELLDSQIAGLLTRIEEETDNEKDVGPVSSDKKTKIK